MASHTMEQVIVTQQQSKNYFTEIEHPNYKYVGSKYQDVLVWFGEENSRLPIDSNDMLYATLRLSKNLTYDTTYKIKLVKYAEVTDSAIDNYDFETIKTITVPKDSTGFGKNTLVLLYKDPSSGSVKVGLPVEGVPSANAGLIYIVDNITGQEQYYLNNTVLECNDVRLVHTWETGYTPLSYRYDFAISSHYGKSVFDAILIEMERNHDDDEIMYSIENGEYRYGRKLIIPDDVEMTLNKITPIFSSKDKVITKIGVQGPQNLSLIINGEEIKIGPSGVFELNDFEITSFGVAPVNEEAFIVDYQYK